MSQSTHECPNCRATVPNPEQYDFCPHCGGALRRAAVESSDSWTGDDTKTAVRTKRTSLTEDVVSTLLEVATIRRALGRSSNRPPVSAAATAASRVSSDPRRVADAFDNVADTRAFDDGATVNTRLEPATRDVGSATAFAKSGAGHREELPPARDADDRDDHDDNADDDASLATVDVAGTALASVPHPAASANDSLDEPTMDAPVATIAQALEALCASSERASQGRSCVVDLLTLVATADGEIDTEEMEVLTKALGVLIGGDPLPEVVQLLIGSSVDAIRNEGRESRILKVATGLRECRAEEEGVHVAIAIAYASYGFSPAERAVVDAIAHAAGLPPSRVTALIREVRREVDPG